MAYEAGAHARSYRKRMKFVLCFDGTGNKFSGTDADSNILKIYRMLDRNANDQFHYYQPGIGTYVVSKSGSHTSRIDRFKSWYAKAKDSAVGTFLVHRTESITDCLKALHLMPMSWVATRWASFSNR